MPALNRSIVTGPGTRATRAAVPVLLAAFAVVLILLTRSAQQTGDALSYAYAIKTGRELFHAHHLLYAPIVRALFLALQGVLPHRSWDALTAAQLHGALWSTCTVLLYYLTIARLLASRTVAVAGALALLFSEGFWVLSTHASSYVPALGCLTVVFWLLFGRGAGPPSRRLLLVIAAFWALSIVYHQLNVLFAVPLLYYLVSACGHPWRRVLLLVLLPAGILVLAAYVGAFLAQHPGSSAGDLIRFPFLYAGYPNPSWGTLRNVSPGGVRTLLENQLWNLIAVPRGAQLVVAVVFGVLLATGIGWHFRAGPRCGDQPSLRGFLLLWVAVYLGFSLWWLPGHKPLFLLTLLPLHVLFLLAWVEIVEAAGGARALAGWLLSGLAVAVGVFHLTVLILPLHSSRRPVYYETQNLQRVVDGDCLVMASYEVVQALRYHFDHAKVLHARFPLLFFYDGKTFPDADEVTDSRCVVVATTYVRPDTRIYGFDGYVRPEEWLSYLGWLLSFRHDSQGKLVGCREFRALATAGGTVYLALGQRVVPVDGLEGLCAALDEASGHGTAATERPFGTWLEATR